MPSVRVTTVLLGVVLGLASTVAAQTIPVQPTLEIQGRQGGYYWVVETAPNGTRRGGWVSAQVPLDHLDRSALQPIPALPAPPASPVPVSSEAANLNDRLARIERALTALAAGPNAAATAAPQPVTSVPSAPAREVEQPQAFTPRRPHPQTREGVWFNAGMGLGFAGCNTCIGTDAGGSGGLSLGGTLNEKWLLGVGTSGWYRSYAEGVSLRGGTFDGRVRFYPSLKSGFFITGGLGLGTIRLDVGGLSATEHGIGALFGIGWDIRIKPNVSLTPFYNGFAVRTSYDDGHVDQFGLGITVH
jgi:hypothetical protein